MRDARRCRTASAWLTAAEDQLALVELMGRQHLSLPTIVCPCHLYNRPETRFGTSSSSAIPYIKVAHVAHHPRSFAASPLRASMTSETPSCAFEHDPLPDSTTHFRLLHVSRGDFGQHVECELSSWPIDDAPSYYAISYTWGDPADTTEITVNGKPLVVRQNCEYVLQQAFATKASRYYWVDAICIAQTSIQERNHQVGIMGKIYSRAKHVFACVGPHADDSEYLMAIIVQRRSILKSIHEWGQYEEFYTAFDSSFNSPKDMQLWRRLLCLFSMMHVAQRVRMGEAFVSFMHRPYFTRVWILQELHLATRVSYCCGPDVQPGEYLRALDSLLGHWLRFLLKRRCRLLRLQPFVFASRPSKKLWASLSHDFTSIESSRGCLRLGISAGKQELHTILRLLQDFHCVDVRDNLYGILSLVRWSDGQGPTPDYTKDVFEVTKHAISLSSQEPTSGSITYQCSSVLKLFDVTLELASLRDAIALRSSAAPQTVHRRQDDPDTEIAKARTYWRGIHIVDDRRQSNLYPCYLEQVQNGRFVSTRMGSQITMRAYVDTKVGDWCLVEDLFPFHNGGYGLILRESDDHRYVVVGLALIDNKDDRYGMGLENEKSSFSRFEGWLDPEDLIVLAWMLKELRDREQVSDKNIENFVNMRVCGWKNSSYFEKL